MRAGRRRIVATMLAVVVGAAPLLGAPQIASAATDGGVDTTFNSGGAGANKPIRDIAFTGDGKIYIAGDFTSYNGTAVGAIARLNADGTLDTSFNAGGAGFAHTTSSSLRINSIDVDVNGDVYAAGTFTSYNGTSVASVARIKNDGSFDATFAPATMEHQASFPGTPVSPSMIRVFGDNVYVSAVMDTLMTNPTQNLAGLVAFSKTGVRVESFVTSLTDGASIQRAYDMFPIPNSTDFYIYGTFRAVLGQTANLVARIKVDGSRNLDYANNASPNLGPNNQIPGAALQSDGKLLLAGAFSEFNGNTKKGLVRVNADATLDTTFTSPSISFTTPSVALDSNGKIYVSGGIGTGFGTSTSVFLARLNTDGTLDSSFDTSSQPNTYQVKVETSQAGGVYLYYTATPDGGAKFGDASVGHIVRLKTVAPTTPETSGGVPGQPTNIRVKINGTNAKVSWTAPTTGGAPKTYTATATLVGARASGVSTAKTLSCTATAPSTTCTISGLSAGKKYGFSVSASNDSGSTSPVALKNPVLVSSSTPEQADSLPATGSSNTTWILSAVAIMLMVGGVSLRRLRRL